ncbi:hypothetical protein F6X50_21405 [Dickeya dianthicola]|uniref:hypothetical protein n=1 Tax=Dickeya dianthicola TaxID=204039 RepID=UPI00136BC0C4|nr:hypothetical protein [Dickeya dianthicola]MCI4239562.1 DUF4238 domain-containing protein [Dickeya dianthicola]MCI4257244.1 DUF4238 domain-containing protein [Dickeya dianthicola]MZG24330.1 hypothetical protein [Dickeya dianthicola]MZI91576.1 hypothetical protein [Dickeya dianthicola]
MAKLTRHEKPLSKADEHGNNPNKITINQHVIPSKHLLEWSFDGKMVEVFDIEKKEFQNIPAQCSYFCVMRLWDQWTESKMLKTNEDNYQNQVDSLRNNGEFTNSDHIMAYYILLCVRVWVANKERPHYPSIFSTISHEYNQAELEVNELEMDGPVHVISGTRKPTSQHMARQVVKMAMSQAFIKWCDNIKEYEWIVYQSDGGDFILSDAFYLNFLGGFHVLPINPKQVLIAKPTYECLIKDGTLSVQFINDIMKKNAVNYYIEIPESKKSQSDS